MVNTDPLACRDGGFAAEQHADQGAIPSGDTVADEHVIPELEWSTFWQRDPRYHRDTFEACDDARVVLCEGRGYPYGEGNSREQKAASKSIRETHSLLRRRHASLQMPLTEASMSNVETRNIPDFRQNTVDSSCGVDRRQCRKGGDCRAVLASIVASVSAHRRLFRNVVALRGS
jgi:hypothetical protein